jgi:hypothetical protein
VAVDVAVSTRAVPPRAFLLARLAALPIRYALGAVVALSFLARWIASLAHVTPYYLPDEYLYPTLARSIATTGQPLVRGDAANFPALLQPILTAPLQLLDPVTAYRLTQALDVLAMSLAAVPVYLLARRLGLREWYALGCGALAVASPGLFYASFMLADPIAYPLALTAVYAAVRALDEPSRRTQIAFLTWSGLATFARVQYVVLPLAFAGAALFVERLRAFRTWRLTAALLVVVPALAFALGPSRFTGVYSGGAARDFQFGDVLMWMGRDAMLLAYSAGWVLVPAALVGLACVRSRVEKAYAAFAVLLAGGLVAEAALIAAIDSKRFQERYLIVLVPLVAPAFGLWLKRGMPYKKAVALLAVALLALSARVPLSGYVAAHGKDDSPLLGGVLRLEQLIGVANGSFLVAMGAAALSVAALVLTLRPRLAAAGGIALALAAMVAVSVGAYAFDRKNSGEIRRAYLPDDLRWVDHTGLKNVGLLALPGSLPERSFEQLFWNRSITDVLRLGAMRIDPYSQPQISVSDDGRLLVPGGTFVGPLLVQTYGSRAAFTGAERIRSTNDFDLWKPAGVPRLALLDGGHYDDGWLARRSFVSLWPDRSGRVEGTLRLQLSLPSEAEATPVTLRAPGFRRSLVVRPDGKPRVVLVRVSSAGPWTLRMSTPRHNYVGDRPVSVKAHSPVFQRAVGGPPVTCVTPDVPAYV